MSIHIGAERGQIADKILLPGDPLRAKYIAETYLDNPVCYSEVRGMYGFTGTYQGTSVSVQGTGMGVPSISIYTEELLRDYGVKKLIRVGTCGAIQKDIQVRDVILAMTATTDSSVNRMRFGPNIDYSPAADFELLHKAYHTATDKHLSVRVGNVFTADLFYSDGIAELEKWANFGILALEMESAALFTLAAQYDAQALSILTVSDHVLSGQATTAAERQTSFNDMMELALETIC